MGRVGLKIAVGPGVYGHEVALMDALEATCKRLGHFVVRDTEVGHDIAFVWNGRGYRPSGPTIYCELGWLPRWSYQLSWKGINAEHHAANAKLNEITKLEMDDAAEYLDSIRVGCPLHYKYMEPTNGVRNDLPEEFILAPLQVETDLNMQHVPAALTKQQGFIDHISEHDLPLPVVFKKHPAKWQRKREIVQRRKQDIIADHSNEHNIFAYLKHPGCKFVVTLNSNTVHDALLCDVPSFALGVGFWPKSVFPDHVPMRIELDDIRRKWEAGKTKRSAYILHLRDTQWTLKDAENPDCVQAIIEQAVGASQKKKRNISANRKLKRINVVAKDYGWLFADLQRHFVSASTDAMKITASEEPDKNADIYIFFRPEELEKSPDLSRTIVQFHDLFGISKNRRRFTFVASCGGYVLTNPAQIEQLRAHNISFEQKHMFIRPIGALEAFTIKTKLEEAFSVGYIGRNVRYGGEEIKRIDWFVRVCQKTAGSVAGFKAILLGEKLDDFVSALNSANVETKYYQRQQYPIGLYPDIYKRMDAIIITSAMEAGPMCLFEALSTGIPVITTNCGWAERLIYHGYNGYLCNDPRDIATAVLKIAQNRGKWFRRRHFVRSTLMGWTLESWVRDNIQLAERLYNGA